MSSIYESIEKQIRKLKTMMARPDDTYSESTRKVLDQAVAVEKMIHSYAEMCNGIEPEVAIVHGKGRDVGSVTRRA